VRAAGKDPVLALMPVPGELDIVLASELMEAGRAVQRGLVTPGRTTLIASTHRVYSMIEKTAIADGRVNAEALIDGARAASRHFVPADFAGIAREAGSVISAALFGALAATGSLPFAREQFEQAIRRGGVGVDASLRAFAGGWNAAHETGIPSVRGAGGAACLQQALSPFLHAFPPASHDILVPAIERLTDYQDERYVAEYLGLLEPIRKADAQHGKGDFKLLRETSRYLALWMSYEDAIRVADLKIRSTRFDRVRQEARAGPEQLVRVHEFLHPRVGEFADILPAGIGRRLLGTGWARRLVERFTGRGRVVETTSLRGFLQLYILARLRPLRRRSLRFQREHQRIREWLSLIPGLAAENYALACEVAACPRLLKGYGDTHLRGNRNFDAVMEALPRVRRLDDAAVRFKTLREAALADESGEKLAEALRLIDSLSASQPVPPQMPEAS
jgi:indolepyruvate ferredoxin oxidoreductase beta subunit